jgi:hypothetical protein
MDIQINNLKSVYNLEHFSFLENRLSILCEYKLIQNSKCFFIDVEKTLVNSQVKKADFSCEIVAM